MKKITLLILLISCIIIWSCSSSNNSGNPTGPGTGGQVDTTELKYDDGTPGIYYYWDYDSSGLAVRMTMPTGKATYKIISFSVYLGQTYSGNTVCYIGVFSWTGSAPADTIIEGYEFTSGTENAWNKYNISSSNITFNGGEEFVIGMGWDGINQPSLGADSTGNGRAWMLYNYQWSQQSSETYFIRAYVENQVTGDIIELNPSKSQSNY